MVDDQGVIDMRILFSKGELYFPNFAQKETSHQSK